MRQWGNPSENGSRTCVDNCWKVKDDETMYIWIADQLTTNQENAKSNKPLYTYEIGKNWKIDQVPS